MEVSFLPLLTKQTKSITPDDVREFLLTRYSEPMTAMRLNLAELPDDFDLLLSGVIDSFGILEMISAIEQEFQIQLDLALLDAEDITRIGPLTRYTAASAQRC
jgi:acyl carrier protein